MSLDEIKFIIIIVIKKEEEIIDSMSQARIQLKINKCNQKN